MASYKLRFKTPDGRDKTETESHPNLNATQVDFAKATTVYEELYGYTTVGVDLNSDTTVWTPE